MPTFLTTRKMPPELAARIEARVRGRRSANGHPTLAPLLVAAFRAGAIVVIVAAMSWLLIHRHRQEDAFSRERAALLDAVKGAAASLPADSRNAIARDEAWLTRLAGPYEGDVVADELRPPGALAAALARPLVYVRGSLAAFATPAGVKDAARTSGRDAFVLCLVDPPASRAEKALFGKVRAAYEGGATVERSTANVHRLGDALQGLPLLLPPWASTVSAARTEDELSRLRRDFDRAPLDEAKKAVSARLLLAVMDEPGDRGGTSELDGERAHDVRVQLVDLQAAKVLLRLRKHVDPRWISSAARAEFATGLDGCALARDLREELSAPKPAGK